MAHTTIPHSYVERWGGLILTSLFWDCECESNHIRPASEPRCPHCGTRRDEQPDSRLDEVLGTDDLALIERVACLLDEAAKDRNRYLILLARKRRLELAAMSLQSEIATALFVAGVSVKGH